MTPSSTPQSDITMTTTHHAIDWFEIPVLDVERAQAFYEQVLGSPMRRETMNGQTLVLFASIDRGVGGCLLAGPKVPRPAAEGSIVYLHAGRALDPVLARVGHAGGRVVVGKVRLPGDMGCYAHVVDTEGNRVGLHAQD